MQTSTLKIESVNPAPAKITNAFWWLVGSLTALVAFLPCLFFYFSGEDFTFIKFVAAGKPFYETAQNLFYRPLPNLLWQADYVLWGLQPFGYHLTNLLLHAVNTGLVAALAYQLTSNKKVAGGAAVLFSLHPIHTEPVVWIAGRPDLLATAFFLMAALAGLKFLQRRTWYWLILATISYALGLFSKESVAGLPLILVAWAFFFARPLKWRQAFLLLPFVIVAILYVVARFGALGKLGGYESNGSALLNTLWNATGGLWLPLLFPLNVESGGSFALLPACGLAFCYAWLGWQLWKNKSLNSRLVLLLLILIYGSLAPALPNAPTGLDLAQARLLYLPSVGFCILAALIWQNLKSRRLLFVAAPSLLAALVIALLPWWQAGQIAEQSLRVLNQGGLPFEAGDTIYYEGLPDSWQGAYIWRNGIDEATDLVLKTGVRGVSRLEDVIVDYKRGRLWTARYQMTDGAKLNWIFAYSVDAEQISPPQIEFGKQNCESRWKWELLGGLLNCENGRGLLWDTQSQKTSLTLTSPALDTKPKTLEFTSYVYFDFQHPQVLSELALLDEKGNDLARHPFDLAADGKWHRYRLYLPNTSQKPDRLIVRILKNRNNILFKDLKLS